MSEQRRELNRSAATLAGIAEAVGWVVVGALIAMVYIEVCR